MIVTTSQLISWILYYKYIILLPIAIVEGPIISVTGGFLSAQGHLTLWMVYLIVMLGDLIGDVVWYYLGYHYGHAFVKKSGKRFAITEEKIAPVKEKFHKHTYSILFLSKITNGLGLAIVVLFTAGLSKIPFKKYMLINFSGQLIWSGVLIAIGYVFGNVLAQVQSVETKVMIFAGVIVVLFFIFLYVRQLHKKVI